MVRPTINIDHAEFATMYQNRISTADIAKHFGVSLSTVRLTRIRLNLPIRRGRFDEEEYRRLFFDGVTYPMMAQQLGISEWTVMEIRKRKGLLARKRGVKRCVRNVR
jgi:hypothetical protein